MKYRNTIIVLGFIVAAFKIFALPQSWKEAVYVLLGVAIMMLAYISGRERKAPITNETP